MVRKVAHRFWQDPWESNVHNVYDWLRYVSGRFRLGHARSQMGSGGLLCWDKSQSHHLSFLICFWMPNWGFDTQTLRKVRESGAKAEVSKVQGSPLSGSTFQQENKK